MFNTFIRTNVVEGNINNYCNYVSKFTMPKDGQSWIVSHIPLLTINLNINMVQRKKDDKKKKNNEAQEDIFYL